MPPPKGPNFMGNRGLAGPSPFAGRILPNQQTHLRPLADTHLIPQRPLHHRDNMFDIPRNMGPRPLMTGFPMSRPQGLNQGLNQLPRPQLNQFPSQFNPPQQAFRPQAPAQHMQEFQQVRQLMQETPQQHQRQPPFFEISPPRPQLQLPESSGLMLNPMQQRQKQLEIEQREQQFIERERERREQELREQQQRDQMRQQQQLRQQKQKGHILDALMQLQVRRLDVFYEILLTFASHRPD